MIGDGLEVGEISTNPDVTIGENRVARILKTKEMGMKKGFRR